MHTTFINQTPTAWLLGQGLSASEAAEILATFGSAVPIQTLRFHRGEAFYRFHGRNAPRKIFETNFWVRGSALLKALGRAAQFEGWLSEVEIARVAKQYYRDIAAISHLWGQRNGELILGEMHDTEFWKIELKGDEYIDGLLGAVAPQPTHHDVGGHGASSSILQGGGLQAFIRPGSPFLCTPVTWC